jgi:uncharacterized protein (DUF1697 family)
MLLFRGCHGVGSRVFVSTQRYVLTPGEHAIEMPNTNGRRTLDASHCQPIRGIPLPIYIALYRGLNVGGGTSVKMEALRALHEQLGHQRVRNYIQSGNIVFRGRGTPASLGRKLSETFAAKFGFAAKVVVVGATRWQEMVAANPYQKLAAADPQKVHLAVCAGEPNAGNLTAILAKTGGRETFQIQKDVIYLHAPDGFGTSKFAAGLEKAAGVALTARNWRTVEALAALAAE